MPLFISFEGVEGSGKTTQIELLKAYLTEKNRDFTVTFEPGGTEVGKKIRDILLQNKLNISAYTELFLYLASRVENTENVIIPSLESNKIVISDRYADSTIAYQVYGRGLPETLVNELNTIATSGINPNITFLLDFEPECGLERKGLKKDRIEKENIEFHIRVRGGYRTLARKHPDRIILLDARLPQDEIHRAIADRVQKHLDHI
ncbi:dTMP kinase [candidate division WOR-3 bacterium]|nr:dTMP kinase [candidate division WOR-3 bacterium]